jgi:TBC1 domain family member 5
MHELLAPFLLVLEHDAIDVQSGTRGDPLMLDMLEARFIEHDAFTLFSILMRSAKPFYELEQPEKKSQDVSSIASGAMTPQPDSPIVEQSRRIHEIYLRQLDPELALHLTDIEILPQIFLMYAQFKRGLILMHAN